MKFPLIWLARLGAGALGLAVLLLIQNILFTRNSALPAFDSYSQFVVLGIGVSVILAVSLNLINGITGQFSLGHAGFMGVGAYTSAYFTKEIGANTQLLDPIVFLIGLVIAAISAGIIGLVVGLPSLRLRGDYLAIVTLGFNLIIVSLIRNIEAIGGAAGYRGIPSFSTFAWIFGAVALCIWSVRNLAKSQLGRAMRAVRDDEIAAEASGINTTGVKVTAFVFSAAWAGVAGALYAHLTQYANPNDFGFLKSVEIVIAVVLGGLGSITGSALAAAGLRLIEEVLREVPGVFWTSLGLIALATYWSFERHRAAIKRSPIAIVKWLATPLVALALVFGLYYGTFEYLNANTGSLRYMLYSIILIVLMLLRPQGLLGRAEWSFNALRDRLRKKEVLSV